MHRKRNPSHSKEGNTDDAKTQDIAGGTFNVPRVQPQQRSHSHVKSTNRSILTHTKVTFLWTAGTEKNVQYLSLKTSTKSGSPKDYRG